MPTKKALVAKTAEVYAKALYQGAAEAGAVDSVDESLRTVVSTIRAHNDLRWTLDDTFVPVEARRGILREVFAGEQPLVVEVVAMMVEMDNMDVLGEVLRAFARIAEQERGIAVLEVTTAVPLSDQVRASLVERMTAQIGKSVALRERVDPSILGGVIINRSGRVLDASVSSQLTHARRTLSSAFTGGEA